MRVSRMKTEKENFAEGFAAGIGMKAWRALLEEVYTTPKPGLVDLYSNGAHTDMDVHTFERSAQALRPYFCSMAARGYLMDAGPEELFRKIRATGIAAEKAMYRATDDINTHKGLIFTLGIFCAAAGRCMRDTGKITAGGLFLTEQQMTVKILTDELEQLRGKEAVSNGERNLKAYGSAGIRGEAILGYPAVWEIALPVMRQGIREKRDWNLIKLQGLFTLMSRVEDSNILSRQDPETLRKVHREAEDFLGQGGAYADNALLKLQKMDDDYIRRNISAGGCADLLAASIFIGMLLGYME